MRNTKEVEAKTIVGVHTHTHTHTGSVSGYLEYKKIIKEINTHVIYKYFDISGYI